MSTNWLSFFFFFNDTATTEIYTLSLHDALPICGLGRRGGGRDLVQLVHRRARERGDRKSTRLNSSHLVISYAVFCLKKKKKDKLTRIPASQHRLPQRSFRNLVSSAHTH